MGPPLTAAPESMGEFGYIELARYLVPLALGLYGLTTLLACAGPYLKDRRLVEAARNAMILAGVVVIVAAVCLITGFVQGDYHIKYIFNYSEAALPLKFKIAGLWAGLDGSMLFWSMLVGVLASVVGINFLRERKHPVGRQLEPWVYVVFSVVQMFFMAVIGWAANPFDPLEGGARPLDGNGLNPLLNNYWMAIHPPTLYFGWVAYTVPFAYGVAALIAGTQGSYWVRKVRRWMMLGWVFNTSGLIMGGLWAYEVLGWGGYWAWDPVENASFLPWFASTAFLHSIMVQERRGMLMVWNSFLVVLTFWLSIFGTFLTRSGLVASVHAFGDGPVGQYFMWFLIAVGAVGLFLVAYRSQNMRSQNRIESPVSRESIFVLNNLVLLAIAAAIMVLTLWPFFSSEVIGNAITVGPPVYDIVCTPLFILLFFLTAIGPGMGWIRTSKKNMIRNYGLASLLAIPLAAIFQAGALWVRGSGAEVDPINLLLPWTTVGTGAAAKTIYTPSHFYPTVIMNYLSAFIVTTLALEVFRAARNRAKRTGKGILSTFETLLITNNRRYGGYVVHIGLAIIAVGVVNSSVYRVKAVKTMHRGECAFVCDPECTGEDHAEVPCRQPGDPNNCRKGCGGETFAFGDYEIEFRAIEQDMNHEVYAYMRVVLGVTKDGREVAEMRPEKRSHRKQKQVTTEVFTHRTLMQDLYVFFEAAEGKDRYIFTFYRNPYIKLLWVGWIAMVIGGVFAALPLGRRRVGLSD